MTSCEEVHCDFLWRQWLWDYFFTSCEELYSDYKDILPGRLTSSSNTYFECFQIKFIKASKDSNVLTNFVRNQRIEDRKTVRDSVQATAGCDGSFYFSCPLLFNYYVLPWCNRSLLHNVYVIHCCYFLNTKLSNKHAFVSSFVCLC